MGLDTVEAGGSRASVLNCCPVQASVGPHGPLSGVMGKLHLLMTQSALRSQDIRSTPEMHFTCSLKYHGSME